MVTANGCLSRTVHTATSGLLARGSGGEDRHRLLQGYQPGAVFPGPFRFRPSRAGAREPVAVLGQV